MDDPKLQVALRSAVANTPDKLPITISSALVEIHHGIKALEVCYTIDDAKYWADAAEALAAWGKMHEALEVVIEAKRLRLYCARRMGQIAAQVSPTVRSGGGAVKSGPLGFLVSKGVPKGTAIAMRRLAIISEPKFEELTHLPNPPAINSVLSIFASDWARVTGSLSSFLGNLDKRGGAAALVAALSPTAAKRNLDLIVRATEVLDHLEQLLRKRAKDGR